MCGCGWVGAFLGMLLLPMASLAQVDEAILPSPRIMVLAGAVTTDFGEAAAAGDGSTIGLRMDLPLGTRAILEPSLERFSLDADSETQVRWQVDFGIRVEMAAGPVRPYIGGALGALLWPGDKRPTISDFVVATYGGFAGLRYDVSDRIGLRGEGRRRWLDGLNSSTATFGIGLSWRF